MFCEGSNSNGCTVRPSRGNKAIETPLSQRTRGDCSGKDFTLSASGNDSTSEDMNTEVAKIVAIKKIHGWGNMV